MIHFMTTNEHKFKEAKKIFKNDQIDVKWSPEDYDEIQSDALEEVVIAALKSIDKTQIMIEDAGLFIEALSGFPGVYSRFVEDTIGNEGILSLLKDQDNRRADFISVVGYKTEKGEELLFKGIVKGEIATNTRGNKGFGYDPIFIPEGEDKTFAEDIWMKNRLSHRKRALEELAKFIRNS